MENKYTYYKPKNSEMMANVYFNKLVVAHFESEKDAQEYIAWKNQPKIDKDLKDYFIEKYQSIVKDLTIRFDPENNTVVKYIAMLKFIENLPTEQKQNG